MIATVSLLLLSCAFAGLTRFFTGARPMPLKRIFCGRFFVFLIRLLAVEYLGLAFLFGDFAILLHADWLTFLLGAFIAFVVTALTLIRTFRTLLSKYVRCLPALLASLLLCCSCELICNFRAVESHAYEPINMDSYRVSSIALENAEEQSDGSLLVHSKILTVSYSNINRQVDNLFLKVYGKNDDGTVDSATVKVYLTDDGNENLYYAGKRSLLPWETSSFYLKVNNLGESNKITLTFETKGEGILIREISANTPRPARIIPLRMFSFFFVFFLLMLFWPKSFLYQNEISSIRWREKLCAALLCVGLCAIIVSVLVQSTYFSYNINRNHDQYQVLAQQLTKGEVTYPETPPTFLQEMENPYDYSARTRASAEAGEFYRWDSAYYNGAYYVYFGIVPCLLLYLPFYLVTGTSLPNAVAIAVFLCLFVVAAFLFFYKLIKRFFPKTPFGVYLLLTLTVVFGSGAVALFIYPGLYCVPIAAALSLSMLGLALWMGAKRRDGSLSVLRLVFGSLSMALVAGCRPQALLLSFLAIPLFFNEIFQEKKMLPTSRRGIGNFLAFSLPYVIVAAGLMYYNAIRFGSPFDFGANYNLTTNDMTVRGFRTDRTFLAIYEYLLRLPRFSTAYPFIKSCDFDTSYLGVTISEDMYGGIFAIAPFSLYALAVFLKKKALQEKKLYIPALMMLVFGVAIAIVDAQMAGILHRYLGDFGLPILLSASLVFLGSMDGKEQPEQKTHVLILLCCLLFSVLHSVALSLDSIYLGISDAVKVALYFWN